MLRRCGPITNTSWLPYPLPGICILFRRFTTPTHYFTTLSPSKASLCVDEECNDFLPWLERKAGRDISSVLAIGACSSWYASDYIRAGDCILKVPYSVQMAPDNLPPEIICLVGDKVGNVAKAALLILLEQRLGQNSEWAPYISRLPKAEKMHSTVFWSNDELEMIRPSALYRETLKQKTQIAKEFSAIVAAFDGFHYGFQDITLQEFAYAFGLVTSRAWESSRGVSMIPFADFLNHDGSSEAYVLSDELKQHSEEWLSALSRKQNVVWSQRTASHQQTHAWHGLVILTLVLLQIRRRIISCGQFMVLADRDYAPGDQILIRYGKFSNATLLLDFGFTVSHNIFDQVLVEFSIPHDDQFHAWKLGLLERYRVRNTKDVNDFSSDGNIFRIKEVRAGSKKGKGIPQALRAFGRIASSNSQQEINTMVKEATQDDGRLARFPLKNRIREIEAHQFLLAKMAQLIEEHKAHIKLLEPTPPYLQENRVRRRKFAQDLLNGELRVLISASAWLENYCLTLSGQ